MCCSQIYQRQLLDGGESEERRVREVLNLVPPQPKVAKVLKAVERQALKKKKNHAQYNFPDFFTKIISLTCISTNLFLLSSSVVSPFRSLKSPLVSEESLFLVSTSSSRATRPSRQPASRRTRRLDLEEGGDSTVSFRRTQRQAFKKTPGYALAH